MPAQAAARRRRDAWLLTSDDGLLIELGPHLGDDYRTHVIDDAATLERTALDHALVVLDAASSSGAPALLQRLATQHPLMPVIVVCADGDVARWRGAAAAPCAVLERSQLHGAMVTRALAEAARRLASADTATTANALPQAAFEANRGRSRRALLLAGVLVVGIALATWLLRKPTAGTTSTAPATAPAAATAAATAVAPPAALRAGAAAAPAVAAPAAPAPRATPQRSAFELLSDARVAFRDERLQLPRVDGASQGDSALELYQRVLALEPGNEEARDGLRRLLAVTRDRIQGDLQAGRLDDAARLLAAYREAGITSDELTRLGNEVNAARPRLLLQQARAALAAGDTTAATAALAQLSAGGSESPQAAALRKEIASRGAEQAVAQQAAQVRLAIASGALLEPAADSARTRLQAMAQGARNHPLTTAVTHELQQALLARAQQSTQAGEFAQSQAWLAAAAELGASPELAGAQAALRAAQDQAGQRRAEAARAAAPAAAAAAAAAEPAWRAAVPTRTLQANYPAEAQRQKLGGYVIVEFMLGPDGRASDPRVVESSPSGVFDAPALAAVARGRFALAKPVPMKAPVTARLRIGFKPGSDGDSP